MPTRYTQADISRCQEESRYKRSDLLNNPRNTIAISSIKKRLKININNKISITQLPHVADIEDDIRSIASNSNLYL